MNCEELLTCIGQVRDEHIAQSAGGEAPRKRRRGLYWAAAAVLAAVLCAAGAVLFSGDGPGGGGAMAGVDSTASVDSTADPVDSIADLDPVVSGYDVFSDPNVLWGGDTVGDEAVPPEIAPGVRVSMGLHTALGKAADTDLFAIVVDGSNEAYMMCRESDLYKEMSATISALNSELTAVYQRLCLELQETLDVSYEEAGARVYAHPEFVAIRTELRRVEAERTAYLLESYLTYDEGRLNNLMEQGFTLAYDASDPTYHAFLSVYGAPAVVIGTKAQIFGLEANGYVYQFYWASQWAAEWEFQDWFSGLEVDLADGNKLTDDLLAAYEENGGEAIPVIVKIAYWGKRYEWREAERIVLQSMGFANKEDLYVNGTEEEEDIFIEKRSRLYYHRDYNEAVVARLLRDGELIQYDDFMNYFSCNFYAELTYERAMELAGSADVAYLDLLTDEDDYSNRKGIDSGLFDESY